jgi:hypothetical protein
MAIGDVRSLSALELSASTARILNLRRIFASFSRNPSHSKNPFFQNPVLNRSLIVKHRVRPNEKSEFWEPRTLATKLIIPINENDLKYGAHYVFVGQKNFERMVSVSMEKDIRELHQDFETLKILDGIPTLDPFLLREQLQRNGITPDKCYFQIAEADLHRMLDFTENEIGDLVRLAVGSDGTTAQAGVMTKKLLSNGGADLTDSLRQVLQMDYTEYREGIFSWKALLYYKWQIKELLPRSHKILKEISCVVPKGITTKNEKFEISEMRINISRSFARSVKSVYTILSKYDNAYKMLLEKNDPKIFKDFLLSAPELFNTLGERLGAVEHLLSYWRFRVPEGKRTQFPVQELIDILGDFETSLGWESEPTFFEKKAVMR